MKSSNERSLTGVGERIITELANYTYLSPSQMITLGIMTDRSNLNKRIGALRDFGSKPLIESIEYGVHPKYGRLENLHRLTPYGKKWLIEHLFMDDKDIKVHLSKPPVTDYFHRKSTINFHIMLEQWCEKNESNMGFFHRYFDKLGNNRRNKNLTRKTRLNLGNGEQIDPDGIFMLDCADGEKRLFCLEVSNGDNTKRILDQIEGHIKSLHFSAPSRKYGHDYGSRVIWLFQEEGTMRAVIRRFHTLPSAREQKNHFFFKCLHDISADQLFKNWYDIDGELVDVFRFTHPIQVFTSSTIDIP